MFSWSRSSHTPVSAPVAGLNGTRTHPGQTISRNAHLSSYLGHHVLRQSTRKVSQDDTTYDTVFQTTNGFALIIRVYLPTDSGRAPSMTLHGVRASHDWLDIRMKVIGYEPIASDQLWRQCCIKLGDAIFTVIRHFQLNPPSILEINDANLRRLQESISSQQQHRQSRMGASASSATSVSSSQSHAVTSVQSQNSTMETVQSVSNHSVEAMDDEVDALIPPVPTSFPELENMPLSELRALLNDESVMDNMIERISEVARLKELKQSIEKANVEAAEENLLRETELEASQTELDALVKESRIKVNKYRELDEKRNALTRPPDVQDTIRELNIAKREVYQKSEEMAECWVESGGEGMIDFVKKFMEIRLQYHTRAAKAERLGMTM
mmetsp:Transcript_22411/g.44783  ORF Transcript_22411/g.44783 Transcript_22411/m.44783 type:complete len:383 (+) Transcript_22411:109-1257(+)